MVEERRVQTAVLLLVLLSVVQGGVVIRRDTLFANTLDRWNVNIRDKRDLSERYDRFKRAVESVERTTSGIVLESLNPFTVMSIEEWEQTAVHLSERSYDFPNTTYDYVKVQKRSSQEDQLPKEMNYWEEEVGLTPPGNQLSCGACWSFPNVGTMEALNRQLTGDTTAFSQQYFVDCTYSYSGCAGGTTNAGYKVTKERQYLVAYEDYPYTGDYNGCPFTEDMKTMKNNALDKIWIQDYEPLQKTELGLMEGLLDSPVAMGLVISDDLFDYSGGNFVDEHCAVANKPHSMLLVGYTETTLRVKASYGTEFGDGGYVNYLRGHPTLTNCHFFNNAYAVLTTYRRELEYEYCNDRHIATRQVCRDSCLAMNTGTKSGWDLAVIPTVRHNNIIRERLETDFPGKHNVLWIGLVGAGEGFTEFEWVDGFTPANYAIMTHDGIGRKYGLLQQEDGHWTTKGSETFETRGLCSRAINCWNIVNAVKNGEVTFDKADLSEGTVAKVKCSNRGSKVVGSSKLVCVGGLWNRELPTCSE